MVTVTEIKAEHHGMEVITASGAVMALKAV